MPSLPPPAPPRRAALALLLAGAVALGAAGCGVKDPSLQVQGASIAGGTATFGLPPTIGVIMAVQMSAKNENSFDIQVRGARGTVALMNGVFQVPISTAIGTWLKSDSTTSFIVPVTIPLQTAIALLGSSLNVACIPYAVQGVADVTATSTFKLERDNQGFNQNGCIPRQTLLSAV
ncbi:MAG: hypothetical protein EOO75_17845, partial [Myxococcales bacterium]